MKDWIVTADRQQQKRKVRVSNWSAGNWRSLGVILVVNEGLRKKNERKPTFSLKLWKASLSSWWQPCSDPHYSVTFQGGHTSILTVPSWPFDLPARANTYVVQKIHHYSQWARAERTESMYPMWWRQHCWDSESVFQSEGRYMGDFLGRYGGIQKGWQMWIQFNFPFIQLPPRAFLIFLPKLLSNHISGFIMTLLKLWFPEDANFCHCAAGAVLCSLLWWMIWRIIHPLRMYSSYSVIQTVLRYLEPHQPAQAASSCCLWILPGL